MYLRPHFVVSSKQNCNKVNEVTSAMCLPLTLQRLYSGMY
jgi:hypothetical protein